MGALLDARESATAAAALDALTATLLDTTRGDAVRLRAFETIANATDRSGTYEADVVDPLRETLRRDASAALRRAIVYGSPLLFTHCSVRARAAT